MIGTLPRKMKTATNHAMRKILNQKKRRRLRNKEITLIASNCNGCLMLHDLGLRYNSPFVNLYIPAEDYIRLLQNLSWYMEQELTFITTAERYPVALLGDVHLHCVHYKSNQEVLDKWNERKARMNLENVFVLFTDRDGCMQEHLDAFEALPYANKAVFTHLKHEDLASAIYIPGFEDQACVGELHRYSGWLGRRYYDRLDYTAWFNGDGLKYE